MTPEKARARAENLIQREIADPSADRDTMHEQGSGVDQVA